jgi:hypothetical protein
MRPHLDQRSRNSRFYFPPFDPALALNLDNRKAIDEMLFQDGPEVRSQLLQSGCDSIGGSDEHGSM